MLEGEVFTWFTSRLVMVGQEEHFQLLSFFQLITLARTSPRGTELVIVMLKTDTDKSTRKERYMGRRERSTHTFRIPKWSLSELLMGP